MKPIEFALAVVAFGLAAFLIVVGVAGIRSPEPEGTMRIVGAGMLAGGVAIGAISAAVLIARRGRP